ncbi:hypothetical protein FRC04_001679 [Tulasnella sp. 424]|nr:hypothetical protein FRC04_001679 [Tulasnella sp. 424]KAG8971123.1 hypothetical protein FRC05_011492 [Tulasnella sp. 425]
MSSGGNSGSRPTKPSSSRQIDPEISQNQLPQSSLYTRIDNAKKAVTAILQDKSNWPQDSVTAVTELLQTINNAPDLRDIPFESIPGGARDSIKQFTLVMEDVCARLKKTHRKYGSNREFADVIKYPFASLSKDGCCTALQGCRNDIDKALAALQGELADDSVAQYPLKGKLSEGPAAPAGNQNQPTDADAGTKPVSQPPGNESNLSAGTSGEAVSTPQPSPNPGGAVKGWR